MVARYQCDDSNVIFIDFSKVKMVNAKPGCVEIFFDGESTSYRFEANGGYEHIVKTATQWMQLRYEQVKEHAIAAGIS